MRKALCGLAMLGVLQPWTAQAVQPCLSCEYLYDSCIKVSTTAEEIALCESEYQLCYDQFTAVDTSDGGMIPAAFPVRTRTHFWLDAVAGHAPAAHSTQACG